MNRRFYSSSNTFYSLLGHGPVIVLSILTNNPATLFPSALWLSYCFTDLFYNFAKDKNSNKAFSNGSLFISTSALLIGLECSKYYTITNSYIFHPYNIALLNLLGILKNFHLYKLLYPTADLICTFTQSLIKKFLVNNVFEFFENLDTNENFIGNIILSKGVKNAF